MPNIYKPNMDLNLVTHSENKHTIIARADIADSVTNAWFAPSFWQQKDAIVGQSSGRNIAYFVDGETSNSLKLPMVLRRYYRGGLVGKVNKDKFLFTGLESTRASQEMAMLAKMTELSLPVPKPVAGLVEKSGLLSCQNAILIERIPNCQDGYQYLQTQPFTEQQWFALGQMIKQFHDAGVYHSDMNIHNILLDDQSKFWLIDFDKCGFKTPELSWQQQTLDRLQRSLLKELTRCEQFYYTEQNWRQLLDGYNH